MDIPLMTMALPEFDTVKLTSPRSQSFILHDAIVVVYILCFVVYGEN